MTQRPAPPTQTEERPTAALSNADIALAVSRSADNERQAADLSNAEKRQKLQHENDYHVWRFRFSIVVLTFAFIWLVSELLLVLSVGLGSIYGAPFKLSDSVVIAFLTTAAATIVGLFAIFLRWLYPGKEAFKSEDRKSDS